MPTLTQEEWDALTREEQKAHHAAEEKIVFGHNVKHRGKVPVEQGIGAPGNENENHFRAIRKYEGEEAEKTARAAAAAARKKSRAA